MTGTRRTSRDALRRGRRPFRDGYFETVVGHIAKLTKAAGAWAVFGDQYMQFALESGFRTPHGLTFQSRAWDQPSKIEALTTLRRLLRERTLVIEPGSEGEALRRELGSLREVLLPSKVFTVAARRVKGHADRASLILLLARLIAEGDVRAPAPDPSENAPPTWAEATRPRQRITCAWDQAQTKQSPQPSPIGPIPPTTTGRTALWSGRRRGGWEL